MECPVCGGRNTKVVDSRDSRDGVRRRRVCNECGHRFTTRERIDETLPMVLKRTGERQPFDRSKIRRGLDIACRKRGVPSEALDRIVAQIETWASTKGDREIDSEDIGERIMHHLYAIDQVAYVRFVSVYRSFESIEEFEHLLREMQKAERVDIEGQRPLFPEVFNPSSAASQPARSASDPAGRSDLDLRFAEQNGNAQLEPVRARKHAVEDSPDPPPHDDGLEPPDRDVGEPATAVSGGE